MISKIKHKAKDWLLWSQKHTQVDMLYAAKGSFWMSWSFVINSGLSLLLVISFANLLPKDIYGSYKYILSLAGTVGFLLFTPIRTAITRAVAKGLDSALIYGVRVQLKFNTIFLLVMGAMGFYYLVKDNKILGFSLLILGLMMPLDSGFNSYGAYLRGKKEFKAATLYGFLSSLINILPMIGVLFLTDNVVIIVSTYGFLGALSGIILYNKTKKDFNIPKTISDEDGKKILSFGVHLSVTNFFSTIAQNIDKIVLFQYLGAVQVAVYSLASAMPSQINGFVKNIGGIVLPKLSEKNVEEISRVFYKRVAQSAIIGAIFSLGYILLSPFVFRLVLPQYLDSIFYSQLLSLNFVPIVIANYTGNVFYSQKLVRAIYKSSISANVARIILYIWLGAKFGIIGIVFATLFTYYLGTIWNFIIWNSEVKKFKNQH